jgi:hypothetical protein
MNPEHKNAEKWVHTEKWGPFRGSILRRMTWSEGNSDKWQEDAIDWYGSGSGPELSLSWGPRADLFRIWISPDSHQTGDFSPSLFSLVSLLHGVQLGLDLAHKFIGFSFIFLLFLFYLLFSVLRKHPYNFLFCFSVCK